MSSMARSYRTLSGSAVLSALVDLSTFFFLWRICASQVLTVSAASPPTKTRMLNRFPFLLVEAWSKRSPLLRKYRPLSAFTAGGAILLLAKLGTNLVYPERKDRPASKLPARPGSRGPETSPEVHPSSPSALWVRCPCLHGRVA